jgi:hypothetical protein
MQKNQKIINVESQFNKQFKMIVLVFKFERRY